MNCDGVSGLLSAYLDGELSAGELLRVEQHLRRCHACADEVDSLRQTIALVSSLEEVEVPADFRVRLHDRLVALGPPVPAVRRPQAAPAWQKNVRRWAVPAAAAAAALAIGLSSMKDVQEVLPPGLTGKSTMEVDQVKVAQGPGENTPGTNPGTPPTTYTPPSDKGPGSNADNGNGGQQGSQEPGQGNPGQLDPGSMTATKDPTGLEIPVQKVSRKTYALTVTAAVADPAKALDVLKARFPGSSVQDGQLVLTVPTKDYEQARADIVKLLPTAALTETQPNYGTEFAQAEASLNQANSDVEQAREVASASGTANDAAELEAAQKKQAAALEELKRIGDLLNQATITIKVEASAQ